MQRKCKMCQAPFQGRSDKIFCSIHCKSEYHQKLRKVTALEVVEINKILSRNRSILLELMGKNSVQKKIQRILLDKKKFNFKYLTHFHKNTQGKIYNYVYDFAWMEFSDNEILIVRKKVNRNIQ